MGARAKFLAENPTARIESRKPNYGRRYYLIRRSGEFMPCGEGDTPARAWADACRRAGIETGRKKKEGGES